MQIFEYLAEVQGANGTEFGFYPGVFRRAGHESEETEKSSEVWAYRFLT